MQFDHFFQDDVVELTKDHGIESSIKGPERESSPKSQGMKSSPKSREMKSPTKGHVAKEAGNSGKAEVHMKSKVELFLVIRILLLNCYALMVDSVVIKDVRSCFLRKFLDRSSISQILHHI